MWDWSCCSGTVAMTTTSFIVSLNVSGGSRTISHWTETTPSSMVGAVITVAIVVNALEHTTGTGGVVVVTLTCDIMKNTQWKTATITKLPLTQWIVGVEMGDTWYSLGARCRLATGLTPGGFDYHTCYLITIRNIYTSSILMASNLTDVLFRTFKRKTCRCSLTRLIA